MAGPDFQATATTNHENSLREQNVVDYSRINLRVKSYGQQEYSWVITAVTSISGQPRLLFSLTVTEEGCHIAIDPSFFLLFFFKISAGHKNVEEHRTQTVYSLNP